MLMWISLLQEVIGGGFVTAYGELDWVIFFQVMACSIELGDIIGNNANLL